MAVVAPAGACPVTQLAQDYQVSRQFAYQQVDKTEPALTAALAPDLPAGGPVLFYLPVTEAWLRRLIVALLLVCHTSYRGAWDLLRDLFHGPRSLGYIQNVAHAAMDRARGHNQQRWADVRSGAPDEIFQASWPVLVGVAVDPTYCSLLSREEQRDGVTWGLRLLELQDDGFAPEAIIGDGSSGLRAGQDLAPPAIPAAELSSTSCTKSGPSSPPWRAGPTRPWRPAPSRNASQPNANAAAAGATAG